MSRRSCQGRSRRRSCAAQFHELAELLVDWGRQGNVSYVPTMLTQPVAAQTVARALADLTTGPESANEQGSGAAPIPEIAGPCEESLVEMAALLAARRGDRLRIEGVSDPADPDSDLYQNGALLPGPNATLAGPTFEEWARLAPLTRPTGAPSRSYHHATTRRRHGKDCCH